MVKCIKSHAGYYSCDSFTQSGERINSRIVFKEIGAELRTNKSSINKTNEEHHLNTFDSPLLSLKIYIWYNNLLFTICIVSAMM